MLYDICVFKITEKTSHIVKKPTLRVYASVNINVELFSDSIVRVCAGVKVQHFTRS